MTDSVFGDAEMRLLVSGIRKGEVSAFQKLVEKFSQPVFNFIFRTVRNHQESEDICQEVFLAVYKYFHTYQENYRLSTWIFTIAHRQSMKHLQKRQSSAIPVDSERMQKLKAFEDGQTAKSVGTKISGDSFSELLDESLEILPTLYRQVFILHFVEELSHKEISEALSITEGSVRMKLYRGRRYLRKKLGMK